jgi:hypothetical protein
MNARVAVTLLTTSPLSYLVWGPWEGVDPHPFSWTVCAALLTFHALGAVIGRWWALALPACLGDHLGPRWPALAIGIAARKLYDRAGPRFRSS